MDKKLELEGVEYEEFDPHTVLVNGKDWILIPIDFDKKEFLELMEEKNSSLLYDTLIRLDEKWNNIVVPYSHILFEN